MLITSQTLSAAAVLENEVDNSPKRQIAEAVAPLLHAAVVAVEKLQAVQGIRSELSLWPARNEHRSPTTRQAVSELAVLAAGILSGDRAFLTDAIRDLRATAPDLVAVEMQNFLDASIMQDRERSRSHQQADSKTLSAANFASRPILQPPSTESHLSRAMADRARR